MKKILLNTLLVFSVFTVLGQKLERYEDALPRILALPPSGTIAQLKRHIPEEPQNPSIYFQMGVVYTKRFRNSDPIKDYAYKLGNAEEALKAFAMAERFLNEKEVRKNEDLYFNFGKIDEKGKLKVEYDSIRKYIDRRRIEEQAYIANAPIIYEKFTRSFSSYDKAHKGFTAILGDYPTFKDLYLLFDGSVDDRFSQVKSDFEECLKAWEEYKSASDTFDIGYNQEMTVAPVEVYRLDGLESKINFLEEKIEVWNYANWVDKTREAIHTEIDKLRLDLAKENLRLDRQIEQAEPDFIRDQFEPLKVSKEVLFNLRKYDLNSVVEPIFIYKEKKHDLIYQEILSKQLDTATTLDVDRKLYLYGQMVNHIKDADTVLNEIQRRNTESSLSRYPDFLRTHYQGISGVNQLVSSERSTNATDVKHYVQSIRDQLYSKFEADSIAEKVVYKKMELVMREDLPMGADQLTTAPLTTHKIENFDGSYFLGGILKNEKEDKIEAYVCGITTDKKVGWFNQYLLQFDSTAGFDSHTRVAAMKTVPGGLAVILHGADTNGTHHNHLFILDERGQPSMSRRLLLNQYPRSINYNERTNTILITYKGVDYLDDILIESELILANYSIYGDLLWQHRVNYKGDLTGVINLDEGYMILGNYNELKMTDGKIARAGGGNTNTRSFALKIDLTGDLADMKTFDLGKAYYTNKAYKVSDDCINIFGSLGAYEQSIELDSESGNAVHMIINSDMEILANSMK